MAKETKQTETGTEKQETKPQETITVTRDELTSLISAEVAKALAANAAADKPVTKQDLANLIDPHGRNYVSTARLRTAKGGTVIKEG